MFHHLTEGRCICILVTDTVSPAQTITCVYCCRSCCSISAATSMSSTSSRVKLALLAVAASTRLHITHAHFTCLFKPRCQDILLSSLPATQQHTR